MCVCVCVCVCYRYTYFSQALAAGGVANGRQQRLVRVDDRLRRGRTGPRRLRRAGGLRWRPPRDGARSLRGRRRPRGGRPTLVRRRPGRTADRKREDKARLVVDYCLRLPSRAVPVAGIPRTNGVDVRRCGRDAGRCVHRLRRSLDGGDVRGRGGNGVRGRARRTRKTRRGGGAGDRLGRIGVRSTATCVGSSPRRRAAGGPYRQHQLFVGRRLRRLDCSPGRRSPDRRSTTTFRRRLRRGAGRRRLARRGPRHGRRRVGRSCFGGGGGGGVR